MRTRAASVALAAVLSMGAPCLAQCTFGFDLGRTITTLNQPRGLYARDMNRDGRTDLVFVNFGQPSVSVLRQTTPGVFVSGGQQTPTGPPWSAELADVDADGDPDAIVCWWDGFDVFLNNGSGQLSQRRAHQIGAHMAAAGDIDNDGDLDVVTADYATGNVRVATNDGTGRFVEVATLPTGGSPLRVRLADFDADGHLDIAANNQTSGNVVVFRNQGKLIFGPRTSIPMGAGAAVVVDFSVADFNADTRPDLAVAWQNSSTTGRLTFVRNDGAFVFTPTPPTNSTNARPTWIEHADIDNDGDLDALVSYWGSGSVQLMQNSGAGVFTPSNVAGGFSTANTVAIADLDQDSDLDFACTAHELALLRVYFSRGTLPRIDPNPTDLQVLAGQHAEFAAGVSGTQPLTYRWSRDAFPLVNAGRTSGADTPALRIRRARPADAGVYILTATNACGERTSQPAMLDVSLDCACDWNASGAPDPADLFDFLEDFFVADADLDDSGRTDSNDLFEFLRCYFNACG
jgi:hypothetical protein